MKKELLGKSTDGLPIEGYFYGNPEAKDSVLIFGGIHGVEPQSVDICNLFIKEHPSLELSDSFLLIIPCLNPDGIKSKTRGNANGVDLNRNFPAKNWSPTPVDIDSISHPKQSPYYPGEKPVSEIETKILVGLISKYNFEKVIAIHTNHYAKDPNPPMVNYDGSQSKVFAEKLSKKISLPVHEDLGYPTPGSLGSYSGHDLRKITITIELDDDKDSEELYGKHKRLFI